MRLRAYHLFLLGLIVRAIFLFVSHGLDFTDTRVPDDISFQNEMTNVASAIAGGFGYESPFLSSLGADPHLGPTSWLAPVYPYFVAFWFWCFGPFSRLAFFCVVLAQCVFSAATCVPILRIGELTVGRRSGVIAAMAWAVFPWFSRWAITWAWEISLSALLAALLIWFAFSLELNSNFARWCGFGALWGFALLVNPALLTVLVASLGWLMLQALRRKLPWRKPALLATVCCIAVVSPWMVRNRVVFGQWSFLRTNFAFEFVMGNVHGGSGRDWAMRSPMSNPKELAAYRRLGEVAYVDSKAVQAIAFVRDYPGEFLGFTFHRIGRFWDGSNMFYNTPVATFWAPFSFFPLSLLLAPALVIAWRARVHGWELYLATVLLYPMPYYITFNQVRYRHVLEPLMLLLICHMVVRLFRPETGPRKPAMLEAATPHG